MRILRNLAIATLTTTMATAFVPSALADRKSDQTERGLNPEAMQELRDTGLDKYLGQFTPVATSQVGDGWTKHTFDTEGGNGPICIAGTQFSAFTRMGDPEKLLIFEQGGGACWQDFYFCNVLAEAQEPPPAFPAGIFDFDNPDNPFADYSILYMPYCDGSVHTGDNDVFDPAFGVALGNPAITVRFHRGLRNQSAAMDVGKATFPKAKRITISGSSAGGVGAAGNAPFLARFVFGNKPKLTVLNDAGPVATNPADVVGAMARARDWEFDKFYPASCDECDPLGQNTAIIDWRLDNDSTIREAHYATDGDATNRFFLQVFTQAEYRMLLVPPHEELHANHPRRYKNFIVSGDDSHTAVQTPLFYTQEIDGTTLDEWTDAFLKDKQSVWRNLVQDFVPVP